MAAVIGLFATANAHMKMGSPVPFGKSSLDNSPLKADGSDFPCKQRAGVFEDEGALALNQMQIGAPQTLSFIGGATHGGGSCQVSLTEDLQPTKDSKWKVIHSIEGGCPFGGEDNLSGDAAGTGATAFKYQIPDSVKPGQYTLAWTWHNKLAGQPEIYQNCAPINVLGGGKKTRRAELPNDLPDMFVANLGPNLGSGCTTVTGMDLKYPNPGSSLVVDPAARLADPDCSKSAAGPPASGGSSTSGSDNTPSPAGGAALQETTIAIAPIAAPTAPAPAPVPTEPAPAPAAAPSPAPAAAPAPAPAAGSSSGTCTTAGQSVCSPDGSQIGTCDASLHVTFMAVAPGTTCKGGFMVMAKRSVRYGSGHLRRGQ